MKRLFILISVALCLILLNYELQARTVNGVVTSSGKKLSNVIVTDGYNFTKSKKNGEFKMEIADSAKFVYIVTPSGYAPSTGSSPSVKSRASHPSFVGHSHTLVA